jgi:hypothetical protein
MKPQLSCCKSGGEWPTQATGQAARWVVQGEGQGLWQVVHRGRSLAPRRTQLVRRQRRHRAALKCEASSPTIYSSPLQDSYLTTYNEAAYQALRLLKIIVPPRDRGLVTYFSLLYRLLSPSVA